MYCPSCGDEFRPGVTTTCPDCGVALVDEPPESRPDRREGFERVEERSERRRFAPRDVPELVEVYSTGPHEAEIVRALLEDAGVPAVTSGGGYDSAYPVTVGSLGERAVLVLRQDGERAAEIIAEALDESSEA